MLNAGINREPSKKALKSFVNGSLPSACTVIVMHSICIFK